MSKKGIVQAFKDSQYNPTYLLTQDVKVLRQDYTRLRDIMQKRLKRLESSDITRTSLQNWVESIGGEIPKISTMKKESGKDEEHFKRELVYWLSELKTYENEKSTLKYQKELKEEKVKELQDAGYSDITEGLFNDYLEFMDYISDVGGEFVLYTETTVPKDIGYNPEEKTKQEHVQEIFNKWRKNGKTLPTELLLLRNL